MKVSYELRIGILAAVCIAITVWGYKFMKGKNLLSSTNYYYAVYADIDELSATSPVLIRGLRVGTVSDVSLSADMQKIVATLDINRGIRLPRGTEALVVNTSIMGGKAIVLNVKGTCSGADCAEKGDTLSGRVQGLFESMIGDADLSTAKEKIGDLVSTLSDSIAGENASNEFARTFQSLQSILGNLDTITGELSSSMSVLDRKTVNILTNIESLTGNLAANNAKISSAIANLDAISTDLKNANIGKTTGETMTAAKNALQDLDMAIAGADKSFKQLDKLLTELNTSEGTLGMLINDKKLYTNLNESSRQLNLLLQDFRLNPKRYVNVSVFGKKQKDYDVPEDDPAQE
jgi:phospholipid/cholesterol/gamma-HCH transport system substrate-binding protein